MDTEQTAPPEILQETVVISDNEVELEVISRNLATFSFEDYEDHIFRLVLSYPLNREFLNREDLAEKINEFSSLVLKIEQYALLFRVNCVAIALLNRLLSD